MGEKPLQKIQSEFTQRTSSENDSDQILRKFSKLNIDRTGAQWNYHSLVTLKRQVLSRILYYDALYRQIIDVPGVICEFGVHWGASLATLANLRGIYEPYNYSRIIHGFDTFEGFSRISAKDGGFSLVGDYSTSQNYEMELAAILEAHESISPIPQIKKHALHKGDVLRTFPKWLEDNPHAIISMAVLDMDVYLPTKAVLERVLPRLTKGSLLVFDELNCPHFPGETQALMEVLDLNKLRLRRFPHQPYCAWALYGE
jgi:hypothetical protein